MLIYIIFSEFHKLMPNFWSNTTQKIYEIFQGPRTKDTEFDAKVEEMKMHEKSLMGLKGMFANFYKNTQGIKSMCKDVYTSLGLPYSENSPYFQFSNEVVKTHQEIERLYDILAEVIGNLSTQTAQWDKYFFEAKENITRREEYRRVYDHYDEKLEKLVFNRNEKFNKGIEENQKELDLFERVFKYIYELE